MSASLFRSLASSWVGLVLAIFIGLIVSPFVVNSLGVEDYGLWAFIGSLTSQFVIFDLGAREAIVAFIARSRHGKDSSTLSEVLSSGAAFFSCAALVALVAMLCLLPFLDTLTEIPLARMNLITVVFLICALDTVVEIAFGLFDATLAGSERYDVMTALNVTRLILNAIALWIVLSLGFGILGLALTTVGLRLVQRFASAVCARRYNPTAEISIHAVTRRTLAAIASFARASAVMHVSHRVIHRIDTVIAGLFLGPLAVTSYAVPLILIEQFRLFAESGNGILTPRLSALHAARETETIKFLLLRWSRYSYLLASGIGVPLLITGPDFLRLWMQRELPEAGAVVQLLTLPFFATLPGMVFTYYLYATARHAINARILLWEALSNLALSLLLVRPLGLEGIAIGTLLPAIIFRGILLPGLACPVSPVTLREFLQFSILSGLPLTIAQITVLVGLQYWLGTGSWLNFVICNAITAVLFITAVWCLYLGAEDKAYIRRRLS